jgi:MFS family permease
MSMTENTSAIPWWKEPTRDQWMAWIAAWLGWTLDAFDFTIFLLIMVPIAQTFEVPLVEVTAVFTVTLWLRLVGATASGWLADRVGRKAPLMISIAWYSLCNFISGFSPTFWFLFLFRALLGIGMGTEWAGWCRVGDGKLAGTLAWYHERPPAGLVGYWVPAVERRLWAAVRQHRMAGPAVARHSACACSALCASVREGAGSVGGKPR